MIFAIIRELPVVWEVILTCFLALTSDGSVVCVCPAPEQPQQRVEQSVVEPAVRRTSPRRGRVQERLPEYWR